jgi:beta-lactam-binding protein with PASTA domain
MAKKRPIDYTNHLLVYLVLFFVAANVSSQIIFRGELVTVPDLTGKTFEEARAELALKKTSLAIVGSRLDGRYEQGRVLSQEPGPSSRIKTNRTVNIIISAGTERVAVPKLEGRSLEWATQEFRNAGLRKGRVSQVHTSRYPAGRIIAQQPPAGDSVGRGAPVDILVSEGAWEPKYIMPDLVEMNEKTVVRRLDELEFQVTEIHYSYYPGLGPGIILKQTPMPGSRLQKRSQITLEVSK